MSSENSSCSWSSRIAARSILGEQEPREPLLVRFGGDVLDEVLSRYLGGTDSDLARWLLSRRDEEVLISITPGRLFSWDYRERMAD